MLKIHRKHGSQDAGVYPYSDITKKIIGCAIEVHKTLGPGFKESAYENALIRELEQLGFKIERQKPITIRYKGAAVGRHRLDLVVDDMIIVELKCAKEFSGEDGKRLISYLKAAKKRIGLLINFARSTVVVKRFIVG